MNARIQAWLHAVRDRLRLALAKRVVWLSTERIDQLGERSELPALVGIIGREYYEEQRKAYPIRSYFELDRVLRLEATSSPRRLTWIGPVAEDHREVIFFDLKPSFDPQALGALCWIPESFLVARALPKDSIATVDRNGLCYFLADSGVNMVRGGAVRTPELFGFAMGLPENQPAAVWSEAELRDSFLPALAKLPASAWLRFASPDIDAAIRKYWRPAAAAAAATFVLYLMLASAYLFGVKKLRERELASLGSEVSVLIDKQRRIDQMASEQEAVVRLLAGRPSTYLLWGLAADAIAAGGDVSGLYVQNGEMIVRGQAKVATDVLTRLSARKDVTNARFGLPVRPNGEYEEFSITLKLDPSAQGGERGR